MLQIQKSSFDSLIKISSSILLLFFYIATTWDNDNITKGADWGNDFNQADCSFD